MVRDNQTNTGEKVHFKGNARKESQKEFLMSCGTHLERRDGEQALLGLPSCSAEINNIHLSWKYDKSYWLIVFVTWHAYSPLSTGCTFLRVNSVPFARCTSRSSLYTLVDIWLSNWLPCTLIINVALINSPVVHLYNGMMVTSLCALLVITQSLILTVIT